MEGSPNDFSIKDIPVDATHYVSVKITPSSSEDLQFIRRKLHVKKIYSFPEHNMHVLEFHDIRHAHFAHTVLGSAVAKYVDHQSLKVDTCSVATLLLCGVPPQMSNEEARKLLDQFGSVWYLHRLDRPNVDPRLRSIFWIEYFDTRDAVFAKSHLENIIYRERQLFCEFVTDFKSIDILLNKFHEELSGQVPILSVEDLRQRVQEQKLEEEPEIEHSLSINECLDKIVKRPPGLDKVAAYDSFKIQTLRVVDRSLPAPNQVHVEKIMSGEDKRTTFMIRNIPNKYTQQMLIDLVNESHKGTYDFLYLRMDFKNKCNVGYAFINFPNQKDAVSFAIRVCGKKWSKFNSEKICSMGYANIQGREALIKKFRDSQVMFEDETYRPKLFYTSGPLKGEEQEFPVPLRNDKDFKQFQLLQQKHLASDQKQDEMKRVVEGASAASSHLYSPEFEGRSVDKEFEVEESTWTPWHSSIVPFRPTSS